MSDQVLSETHTVSVAAQRGDGAGVELVVSWLSTGGLTGSGWVEVTCAPGEIVPLSGLYRLSGSGCAELIRGLRVAVELPWVKNVKWLLKWDGMSSVMWVTTTKGDAQRVLAAMESWPVPMPMPGPILDVVGV